MKKAHFSRDLFGFLEELRSNNRREWFEANRTRYERDVREPMLTFISDFAPRLRKISPKLVADPRPSGGSMFRIYRDVRFSPDKKPYKTHVAARFSHIMGRDVHAPGFYVHLEPSGVQANALCERLIGTLRRECLDWMIPFTEDHLRRTLWSWLPHYNCGRPHTSLGPGLPVPRRHCPVQVQRQRHRFDRPSRVVAHPVLNGLHHEYSLLPRAA
jgi:hypothetical protein